MATGILGAALGGAIRSWCKDHPGEGCVNKRRSVIDTDSIPVMQIFDRQATGPCNVPMYNFDQCHDQLQGIAVMTSIPEPGEGQFDNVPPACMDLAGVLSGSCNNESPRPTPCGSACLLYTGLTDDNYATLSKALGG
ncbi:MAG: hypothetical protein Q9160_009217 [Pyrenula sp. 1 TL-2023]